MYPDFRIPITVDEEYMWEHFGAMDKDSYYNRTRGKILDYLDERWLPGINMITTYETKFHPFNSEKAYRQINWIKNRYREAFPDLPADGSLTLYDLICYEGL